jgi:protoheme IX farnesyltransferase
MAGYAMAPGTFALSTLLYTTTGTGLCVMAANSINQWIEVPYDSQMARTRNRVLVRHSMNPTHAFVIGTTAGILGTGMLYYWVNPYAALLGFSNILLYTCVYTPMKRTSIYNTWAGAVVGAIPPVIGWVASSGTIEPGAILLALSLYSWQFPHFNALSWNLRPDYSKAGYRMMSVIDPKLNARVSLRHALALFPISIGFWYYDIVTWLFLVDSTLLNVYFSFFAFRFWKNSTDQTARKLFFASLLQLPIYMALLLIHKQDNEDDNYANRIMAYLK